MPRPTHLSRTITLVALLGLPLPALALGMDYSTGNTNNGGYLPAPQQQPYPSQPQQYYQPQEPAQPQYTATRIRLSGSGNNTARQAVIEGNPELLARVNARQVSTRSILIGRVDLDGDGSEEIFAYNEDPHYCSGSFCPFSVYQVVRGQPLRPLLLNYMTTNDIAVLDQASYGWRYIVVADPSGQPVALEFNGREYQGPYTGRRGWPHYR